MAAEARRFRTGSPVNVAMDVDLSTEALVAAQRQWNCPPELDAMPVPRRVRRARRAHAVRAFFGLCIAGLLVLVLTAGWRERQTLDLLNREGVATQATVVEKRSENETLQVQYVYRVNGLAYHDKVSVSQELYETLRVNSPIDIRYAASRPEISRIRDQTGGSGWVIGTAIGLLCLMAALLFGASREKHLLKWGRPVCAMIVNVLPDEGYFSVRYRFLDATGNPVAGGARMSPSANPATGQILTVLYDPARPRCNMIYRGPTRWIQLDTTRSLGCERLD